MLPAIVEEERPSAPDEASVVEKLEADPSTNGSGRLVVDNDPTATVSSEQLALVPLIAPMVLAAVALISGFLAVQRASVLVGWEATFTGAGSFVVESCQTYDQWGPDQWHCPGRLTAESQSVAVASTMVVSRGAMPSLRPYVGQQWEVFFALPVDSEIDEAEVPEFVYADQLQLSEITRLYISIFPRVLLSVGAAGWLVGWWFKRRSKSKSDGWWVRRLPGMSVLQRRSSGWIVVAFATYIVYRLIAYYLLGSVGVA
jgi:hypothetical protein